MLALRSGSMLGTLFYFFGMGFLLFMQEGKLLRVMWAKCCGRGCYRTRLKKDPPGVWGLGFRVQDLGLKI